MLKSIKAEKKKIFYPQVCVANFLISCVKKAGTEIGISRRLFIGEKNGKT